MKNMIRGILLLSVLFAMPVVYGQAPKGVAGVGVVVKQNPTKRAVTDARGNFSLEGLPAGSYTLTIRPQRAQDSITKTTVATSYSIKVEGTKTFGKSNSIERKTSGRSRYPGGDGSGREGAWASAGRRA